MSEPVLLPGWLYQDPAIAQWELDGYAKQWWHPVAAVSQLQPVQSLAVELLGHSLLLTRDRDGLVRCFRNRCPHRGVELLPADGTVRSCRKLVCPYHGWTYNLEGELLAAAREDGFVPPLQRADWPLEALLTQEDGPLIWVALGDTPFPLPEQLKLIHGHALSSWQAPLQQQATSSLSLQCNWKVAHDNTLDDYHVAIAHPTTLHREQGPVRDYRHLMADLGNALVTPHPEGGLFFTFGLAPWTHVLIWPDGRIALLEFLPLQLDCCQLQLRLFASSAQPLDVEIWKQQLLEFLQEDRRLIESVQRGSHPDWAPGPAHQLEQRIVQWQQLYRRLLDAAQLSHSSRSQIAIN